MLSWDLSNTLQVDFCLTALEEVWSQLSVEIINTDQGSQFTSSAFIEAVLSGKTKLSMDGRGRCIDNVFTERIWRSLKYEEVYIKSYIDGLEAWQGINEYWHFYNTQRPHKSLGGHTPSEVFSGKVRVPPIQLRKDISN